MAGRIAIIGGGPAGLMAADRLSRQGHIVTVFERMPTVGRKFLMAGRGGLNITHSEGMARFMARYGPEGGWLAPMIAAFTPADLRAWCAALGEETFVGSSGRVFPKSFKASPLLRAMLRRLDARGVTVRTRSRVVGLEWNAGYGWTVSIDTVDGGGRAAADAVLFACGGASWPTLGSDASWVDIIPAIPSAIAQLAPANCGLEIAWSDVFGERFAGKPIKGVSLQVAGDREGIAGAGAGAEVRGDVVIAGYGLEGGAVYGISRTVREVLGTYGRADLRVELKPDVEMSALAARLGTRPRKETVTAWLRKRAGLGSAAIGLVREGYGPALPDDPVRMAALVKVVRLPVRGLRGLDRAISTAGGLRRTALTHDLMLRDQPGVFAAGEMLDWEAPTGGYLLQACFSSAVWAAEGIDRYLSGGFDHRSAPPLLATGPVGD